MERTSILVLGLLLQIGVTVIAVWGDDFEADSVPNMDMESDQVTLFPEKPQRIASVTLASDEILMDLVNPNKVVGLTYLADSPAISNIAEKAHVIARRVSGQGEGVCALDPDLAIVARFTRADFVTLLEDAGIPVVRMHVYDTIEDVRNNIRWLGAHVGEVERAKDMIEEMDRVLASVTEKTNGVQRPSVLYYGNNGWTSGKGTIFDELLNCAGGSNAALDVGLIGHGSVSIEKLYKIDPDVIILSGYTGGAKARDISPALTFKNDPIFSGLTAVKNGRVYILESRHITCISHHLVKAAEDLAKVLHPVLFK